jgi:WG containing repeat
MGRISAKGFVRLIAGIAGTAGASLQFANAEPQKPVAAKTYHTLELLPLGRGTLAGATASEKQLTELKQKYPLRTHPKSYFPMPICAFEGGRCGAVDRNGRVVVAPEFDWVSGFQEDRAIVMRGGRYGFVTNTGRVIAEPTYDRVGAFKHGFAQVILGGKMGIIDRQGRLAVEPNTYSFAAVFGDNSFWVSKERQFCEAMTFDKLSDGGMNTFFGGCRMNNPYPFSLFDITFHRTDNDGASATDVLLPAENLALVDGAGEEIRPPHFTDALLFDQGNRDLAWAKGPAAWGLLRSDGHWQVEPRFEAVRPLIEGFAAVKLNNQWGFVDRAGKLVIEPKFESTDFFQKGHAAVSQGGLWGFIDKTGRWVVQPKFDQVRFLRGNLLTAARGKDWGLADVSGKWVVEPRFDNVYPHDFETKVPKWEITKDNHGGVIDENGKLLVEPILFGNVQFCDNGTIHGTVNNVPHMFAPDGKPLTPPKGELVAPHFCKGPFTYKVGGKFGFIDGNMKPLTPAKFESAVGLLVKLDGKFGLLNADMTWKIEPKYDELKHNGVRYSVARVDGMYGILSPDQSWLLKPKYDALQDLGNGTALARVDGKSGMLNIATRKWIVPARYDAICSPSGIMIEDAGKRGFIDSKGKMLISAKFHRIGIRHDSGLIPFQETPESKWGFADLAGSVVIEAKYENQSVFKDGIAWVRTPNELCPIDRRGAKIPSLACVKAKEPVKIAPKYECKIGSPF